MTDGDGAEGEFVLVLNGFQDVLGSFLFVDLDLACTVKEPNASCSGMWESLGLASQDFGVALTAQ